jgi:hypothetical protein
MKELKLADFLDSVRAEGVTDSEGVFTISHAQAMKKMARYSLPYPEAWVLKIVQAAVIWKASEIVIKQTRLYTTIEFCPREKKNVPTEQSVVATLLGHTGASAVPVGNLCLALRTLVRIEDYSFVLTLNTGRRESSPLYAGRDAQSLPLAQRMRLSKRKTAGIKIVVIHLREGENLVGRLVYRFVPWLRRDRQIATELDRCASVCSIPIHVNRRHLTDLLGSVNFGLNSESRPLLLSGVKLPGEPALNLAVDSSESLVPYYSRPREIEKAGGGRADFSGWFLCQAHRKAVLPGKSPGMEQTKHELHWVCDGVVVQCDTFLFPTYLLKLVIFLSADGFQTDITGMLLQDSLEKTERWESHFELVKKELEWLSTRTQRFFPDLKTRKKRVEAPTVEEYLCKDFFGLSELESPQLKRRFRPATRRRSSRRFDHGLTRTESGKYVSEVVRSKDGSSHMIIRASSGTSAGNDPFHRNVGVSEPIDEHSP